MAFAYVPAYKGYIADVPRVWFKRCDGRVFYFDEITQSQATPNTQFIDINAGWSIFPVAQIPGQSTMEISLTSGQFNTDLFELSSNQFDAIGDGAGEIEYDTWFTETVDFPASGDNAHKATLTYTPKSADDIYIKNVESGISIVSGNTIQVTDAEGSVEVSYLTSIPSGAVAVINTQTAVMGEALLRWPVYSAAEDCTESDIQGYVEMKVYRCRVTQAPGFDSSYKSAGTHQITLATLDAKRVDNASYSVAYIQFPQGN